jgi:hypothetical protein
MTSTGSGCAHRISGRHVEPSRFWLRRDDDDQARQVVYDQLRLDRYSDRQKRAILKTMARGKPASHRDIRQAARRATGRPRGERVIAVILALSVLAIVIILFAGRDHRPNRTLATETATSARQPGETAGEARAGELTTLMDQADRAWLNDVGAGKVTAANDGSDVLSLPRTAPAPDGGQAAALQYPQPGRDGPNPQR